jgi:hypothetical protein
MATCFVIQPFDSGKFDKRYEDVFKPAIIDAGLEPYRVDEDAGVDVPIDAIETGIRNSRACLADITTDNPNVWYELGFAFALGKPVVMVCAEERTGKKYPFDIQHRTITPYKVDSTSDFESLKKAITKRLKAFLTRDVAMMEISRNERVAPVDGLTQLELIVLASAAGSVLLPGQGISAYMIKTDVERMGFTSVGFTLGTKRLVARNFVDLQEKPDYNGETYTEMVLTEAAWDGIEQNESKFLIRKNEEPSSDSHKDMPF